MISLSPIIIEEVLSELTIKNFAIIDNLDILFNEGLTVLTGETGTGKSVIIEALDFLMGSRAQAELIKTSTVKAVVEGTFNLHPLQEIQIQNWFLENGFENRGDNYLVISRELTIQGSKARINGSIANISHLIFLKELLLTSHVQSEQIELLKPENHIDILDSFGDKPHKELLTEFTSTFYEYESLKNKLKELQENIENTNKKIKILEFEINEIKSAQIKNADEDTELQLKREVLLNKKELIENTSLIQELIDGENQNNLLTSLSNIKKILLRNSKYDKCFDTYIESIECLTSTLKDLLSFTSSYLENIDQGKDNLNKIEERLDSLNLLKKKYGKTLLDVVNYLKKVQSDFYETNTNVASQDKLETGLNMLTNKANQLADNLTKSREKVIKAFVNEINKELMELGFKHVLFVVELTQCNLYDKGKEKIQFLFTSNVDEVPKPLSKIVSGGELSRIILAIKSITCAYEPTNPRVYDMKTIGSKTMIFDEIDIGVSGEVAANVAKKLYKISKSNQVICITHNPIVASMADKHLVVEKIVEDGTTRILVKEVSNEKEAEAIATLLTPDKRSKERITSDAMEFAKSLIENAKKAKKESLLKTS